MSEKHNYGWKYLRVSNRQFELESAEQLALLQVRWPHPESAEQLALLQVRWPHPESAEQLALLQVRWPHPPPIVHSRIPRPNNYNLSVPTTELVPSSQYPTTKPLLQILPPNSPPMETLRDEATGFPTCTSLIADHTYHRT